VPKIIGDNYTVSGLNLLGKPEFLRYLNGLPDQSFHGVLVVDGATGQVKELVTTQEGDSPPIVSASPAKETKHNGSCFK
jgi:hypothetical protein